MSFILFLVFLAGTRATDSCQLGAYSASFQNGLLVEEMREGVDSNRVTFSTQLPFLRVHSTLVKFQQFSGDFVINETVLSSSIDQTVDSTECVKVQTPASHGY